MCHINTNSNIVSQGDINSLVVGIINRQRTPFTVPMIREMVIYHSAGARVEIKIPDIENLIKSRLDTFVRNDYIVYKRGQYYPKKIVRFV